MTTTVNDGGPAFPSLNSEMTGIDSNGVERFDTEESGGMTLRDYFAAKAMQGLLSGTDWEFDPAGPMPIQVVTDLVLSSYQIAGAMIKARSATV